MNSSDNPLVSVVIPSYNRPEFLVQACESVFEQTFDDIEVIVVDDCSTADYSDVVQKLEGRIVYLRHEQNRGGSAARNTGVIAAKGRYVAFLDDDDYWLPEKIQKQLSAIVSSPACHCGYIYKSNGKERVEAIKEVSRKRLTGNNLLAGTSGLLCRRDILLIEQFDGALKRSQDWDLYLRIAKHGNIAYVAEPLYVFDNGDHARMTNVYATASLHEIYIRCAMLRKHREVFEERLYRKHIADLILHSITRRNDKAATLKLAVREAGLLPALVYLVSAALKKIRRKLSREPDANTSTVRTGVKVTV